MASCSSLASNSVKNSKSDISFKCGFCGSSVFTENEFIIHIKDHYKKKPGKQRICEPDSKQESHILHPNTSSDVGLRRGIPVFDNPLGIEKSNTPVVPVLTNDQPCDEFVRTDCTHYGCGKTIDEIEKCSVSNITTLDFSTKKWKCSKCRYSTNKKRNLNKHNISMHTLEKKWKCAKCNFSTKSESNLDKHDMNRHSLEKKWKCSKCDFSSNYKQSFNRHNITIHALEKKWKCAKCDFSTNHQCSLYRHNKTMHTLEKKVEVCKVRFLHKPSMQSLQT